MHGLLVDGEVGERVGMRVRTSDNGVSFLIYFIRFLNNYFS